MAQKISDLVSDTQGLLVSVKGPHGGFALAIFRSESGRQAGDAFFNFIAVLVQVSAQPGAGELFLHSGFRMVMQVHA